MTKLFRKSLMYVMLVTLCFSFTGITNASAQTNTNFYNYTETASVGLTTAATPAVGSGSIQFGRNTEPWTLDSGIDFDSFDFLGRGEDMIKELKEQYEGYYISYFGSNNTPISESQVNSLCNVMAKYEVYPQSNSINVRIQTINIRVLPSYTSVTGPEGTTFYFSFTTNLPTKFQVNIGTYQEEGGIERAESVIPVGSSGTYVGSTQLTIPYGEDLSTNYYINIRCDCPAAGNPRFASVPLTITPSYDSRPYKLYYAGNWELITTEGYRDYMTDVFYSTYPRLYKRWGTGTEPTAIYYDAVNSNGIAWNLGKTVCVTREWGNNHPEDRGYFAHELTHVVESYNSSAYPTLVYPDGSRLEWWIEGFATYGRFRYYEWANADQVVDLGASKEARVRYNSDGSVYRFDWLGTPSTTNNGSVEDIQWFFSWMDYNYPTTKDANGNKVYGLIDSINLALKNGTYNDNIFVQKTGYTMWQLMEKYTEDVNERGWRFTGFANYPDNWLTEDIPGMQNPVYPVSLSANTLNNQLDHIVQATDGFGNEGAEKLFDGDVGTKYCTDASSPYVVFAMKNPVTVKSYAIATGNDTSSYTGRNPQSWTLYGSTDGNSWNVINNVTNGSVTLKAVDSKYFKFTTNNTASYKYYKLQITSCVSGSTVQLSEFSLYAQ